MCLMLFGVFAGQGIRAFSDPNHRESSTVCVEAEECSDSAEEHGHTSGDSSHSEGDEHDSQCPSEPHHHHHHGPSCSGNWVAVGDTDGLRLAMPVESRIDISSGKSGLPDGPVLSLDKPPLI